MILNTRNSTYKVGTKAGVPESKLHRNVFEKLILEDYLEKMYLI